MTRITLLTVIFCALCTFQGFAQKFGQSPFSTFNPPQPIQHQPQQQQQQQSRVSSVSCPEKNGRYPVSGQCDAYIECKDGVGEEKLCPEGLLFNDQVSPFTYPCQYPIDVNCGNRAKLQPALPTEDCPHQFGYFRLGDAVHCGQFMNCVDGRGFTFDCPEGLAFDKDSYRCDWPDMVVDCDAEAFLGFTCPKPHNVPGLGEQEYQFYQSPSDCQRYYICINGRPRLYNCGEGNGFNDLTNACDAIENVTSCANQYRGAKPVQLNQPSQGFGGQFNQQRGTGRF